MTKPSADKRLERLLVMVPWVSQSDGPEVEEVCRRFAMTEKELADDLQMLFMCGLYPFTPDTLIEADIVEGRVWIRYADAFERPPTFTRQEAVSLLAAASTVADLPDHRNNSALQSAICKLARALGINDTEVIDIELAPARGDVLDVIRQAIAEHRTVEVDYYSYGRDAWNRRQIDPYRLFNSEGQWYIQGRAAELDELRTFRADRTKNPVITDKTFTPPRNLPDAKTFQARANDPTVVLDLDAQGEWVASQYPLVSSERLEDGRLRVTLQVSEPAWLERLLLRLGRHATVFKGEADLADTARRLLRLYEADSSPVTA